MTAHRRAQGDHALPYLKEATLSLLYQSLPTAGRLALPLRISLERLPGLHPPSLRMSTSEAHGSCHLKWLFSPLHLSLPASASRHLQPPTPTPAEPQQSHFPGSRHPGPRIHRTSPHVDFPLLGLRCQQQDACRSHSASVGFSVRNSFWRQSSQPVWWVPDR